MPVLHDGGKSEATGRLQRGINKRLVARGASDRQVKVDKVMGAETRKALRYASYLLGVDTGKLASILAGPVSEEDQIFVLNPGKRTPAEMAMGKKRVAAHKLAVKKRKQAAVSASGKRKKIVEEALKAAANYRKRPGAYHYLAGGLANVIYLTPSPSNYRSDCSQFVASVYKGAGLPSPASVPHQWASTFTMVKAPGVKFVDRAHRKPGMPGMYGSRTAPHHTEIYVGEPDVEFVGHGSPPIDSQTPGQPDYYLDFPFLN